MPRNLALGFVLAVGVLVPTATLSPTVALGDPIIEFFVPKLIVTCLGLLLGWSALALHHRQASLITIASLVLMNGLNKWISLAIISVLVSSSVAGPDLWTAMIGTSGRLDGALVTITLLHLIQVSSALVRDQIIRADEVTAIVIAGGALVSLILLLEASNRPFWGFFYSGLVVMGSPVGSVGNIGAATNLLAVTFVLSVMSTVTATRVGAWYRWGASAIIAAGVSVHVGRAGVSGAVIGLFAALCIMLVLRHSRWYLPAIGAMVLVMTISIGAMLSTWTAERAQLFEVLSPTASPDLNLQHRFTTWSIGWRSIMANPLFGTGNASFVDQVWVHADRDQELLLFRSFLPQHLIERANRVGNVITAYDAETETLYVRNAYYDKVHNYFLDIGVAYGAVSMTVLLGMWLGIIWIGLRSFSQRPELLAVSVAYLAALQFWFMSINVDPLIYVAIGALAAEASTTSKGLRSQRIELRRSQSTPAASAEQ